jgi:hypothetical protein
VAMDNVKPQTLTVSIWGLTDNCSPNLTHKHGTGRNLSGTP